MTFPTLSAGPLTGTELGIVIQSQAVETCLESLSSELAFVHWEVSEVGTLVECMISSPTDSTDRLIPGVKLLHTSSPSRPVVITWTWQGEH